MATGNFMAQNIVVKDAKQTNLDIIEAKLKEIPMVEVIGRSTKVNSPLGPKENPFITETIMIAPSIPAKFETDLRLFADYVKKGIGLAVSGEQMAKSTEEFSYIPILFYRERIGSVSRTLDIPDERARTELIKLRGPLSENDFVQVASDGSQIRIAGDALERQIIVRIYPDVLLAKSAADKQSSPVLSDSCLITEDEVRKVKSAFELPYFPYRGNGQTSGARNYYTQTELKKALEKRGAT